MERRLGLSRQLATAAVGGCAGCQASFFQTLPKPSHRLACMRASRIMKFVALVSSSTSSVWHPASSAS